MLFPQVIIWVELTAEQRAYYKAIYEKEIGTVRSPGPVTQPGRSLHCA
mgnify:CR=1 FL=1